MLRDKRCAGQWVSAWVLFVAVFLSPIDLRAQEGHLALSSADYDLLFSKALLHINKKQYQMAIQELNQALAAKPNDVEASYYLGVVLSKVGKDAEAEKLLKKVIALDPHFEKAHFDLSVVEYDLGKYQEALQELELAESVEPNRAMIYYYQGLALHQLGDYERSSPRFLRAAELAPELGLTAHYYAGVGYYRRGILKEARDDLEEAVRIDPTSQVAQSAREFLAQIDKKAKRWDLSLDTAYQYDSNVILLPGGSALPEGISQKDDSRMVVNAKGNYRIIETPQLSMGVSYAFYHSLHFDLTEFNVQSHKGTGFIGYQKRWVAVRIPYEFNYVLVDLAGFLGAHAVSPMLTLSETPITYTQIRYSFQTKDFVNTPQFLTNDDRDGINHMVGITQSVVFAKTGLLRVGYSYDTDLTGSSLTEDDWEYNGQKVFGELRMPTLRGLRLALEATYYIQRYQNPNSFSPSGDKRTDEIQIYTATLSRSLGKWISLTLQYLFNRNDSNLSVFDYDRQIYSASVTGAF